MKISILLPVYNAKDYLKQSIESILASTEKDFELLAIDDGSQDGSLEILQSFAQQDSRVKILSQNHGGIVKALNYGLKESRGQYIARMDADDVSYGNRFTKQMQYLEAHPEVVAVGSWVRFIDRENRPFFIYQTPVSFQEIQHALWQGNGGALVHPAVMIRREAIEALGGYREEYRSLEDLDLYIRLLAIGELHNIPEVLLDYRQHFESVNYSSNHDERKHLHEKLMKEHCKKNHKSLPQIANAVHQKNPQEVYVQWANWALGDGFYKTFFFYACKIISLKPLSLSSWFKAIGLMISFCLHMMKKIKNKVIRAS